ncbi:MAG: hypothetical protein CMB80_05490 [Flammeovirgaceae bacterium]|nr:hypothetical protein [Flammeovirgaceae bacterium]|tara:strand:+ start:5020 stop:5442 length:423 start_codon:yes stop_codon:yes gene_type:complete
MTRWYSYRVPFPDWNEFDRSMDRISESIDRLLGRKSLLRETFTEVEEVVATPGGIAYYIVNAETGKVILSKAWFSDKPEVDDLVSLYWDTEGKAYWQDYKVVARRSRDNNKGDKETDNVWLFQLLVTKCDDYMFDNNSCK